MKCIVARSQCTVPEAVYIYNVTPKDGARAATAPANALYRYEVRVREIDSAICEPAVVTCKYEVGDRVWVRDPSRRCDKQSSLGTVTKVISAQTVEVDGMPRHVRDLRVARVEPSDAQERGAAVRDDADEPSYIYIPAPCVNDAAEREGGGPGLTEAAPENPDPEREATAQPEPLRRSARIASQRAHGAL